MTTALAFIGCWCIASATFTAGALTTFAGRTALVATDVLFGLAGIGVLCLLLSRMIA